MDYVIDPNLINEKRLMQLPQKISISVMLHLQTIIRRDIDNKIGSA